MAVLNSCDAALKCPYNYEGVLVHLLQRSLRQTENKIRHTWKCLRKDRVQNHHALINCYTMIRQSLDVTVCNNSGTKAIHVALWLSLTHVLLYWSVPSMKKVWLYTCCKCACGKQKTNRDTLENVCDMTCVQDHHVSVNGYAMFS